jgi:hypothetical protein
MGRLVVDQNGNIFMVDFGNNRVQVFDPGLSCINQWGGSSPSPGSGSGDFDQPWGITLDNGGSASASVYVSDIGNRRIQKFTHSGSYVTEWTANYQTPGPTPYPTQVMGSITTDASNNVYMTTQSYSAVYKFPSDGSSHTLFNCSEYYVPLSLEPFYRGIALDASGSMYIACGNGLSPPGNLRKLDSLGNRVGDFFNNGSGGVTLKLPTGIAMDGPSTIYVTDYTNQKIYVFTQ